MAGEELLVVVAAGLLEVGVEEVAEEVEVQTQTPFEVVVVEEV